MCKNNMSRRYLSIEEATSALKRGKGVETFLGGCDKAGQKCIRWASFSLCGDKYIGKIWEAIDEGSENFLDVYSFSPASGEWDIPANQAESMDFEAVLIKLDCLSEKLVNSGVVQDEYAEHLSPNL